MVHPIPSFLEPLLLSATDYMWAQTSSRPKFHQDSETSSPKIKISNPSSVNCPLYLLSQTLPSSTTDQARAPSLVKFAQSFPSRLVRHLNLFWGWGAKLLSLTPLRTKSKRAGYKRRSSWSTHTFPVRPPRNKHTTFQPENVTTQCPILPLFSMPQEPWEALTRFTVVRKKKSTYTLANTPSSRQSFPKVNTQMSTCLTSVAWDFCTSDFVKHLLLHCLFEKSLVQHGDVIVRVLSGKIS